jgi:tetratricopeptide (TPR) repeat protein
MAESLRSVSRDSGVDSALMHLLDEIGDRVQAGDSVDVEAYAQAHPEYADRLRQLLPAVRMMADLGRSAASGEASVPPAVTDAEPVAATLGDFRILREIGRGGMGVVYEAEQISLNRRVALKVLPFAATMDPRHLQRFKNEAQAAAGLHHSNIVPVHYVGCERGVHFFAMQLIEGQTLAAVLQQLRQPKRPEPAGGNKFASAGSEAPTGPYSPALSGDGPDRPPAPSQVPTAETVAVLSTEGPAHGPAYFRTVARLGIQAAEALEHAHQLGVVHRDVKPGNLLLDPRGNLWVTDFGLARLPNDPGLTLTGDLIGTLRYMSPEQALAKRVVIDHRTDIYSLGATLYELLALRPVFDGKDRQEVLRQIAFEEPRPPRRWNKAIPVELETIVLKAMEKNPQDRYATAQELADDLRRFLEDKPIQARCPSLVQRARKWARRHRAATLAATICLLVTLAAGVGSTAWVLGERSARQQEAEAKVVAALEEAVPALQQGNPDDPSLISAVQRAEAQLAAGAVDPGLRRRVEQLKRDQQMLARLEEARLQSAAGSREIGWDFAEAARSYARAFAEYGLDATALGTAEAAQRVRASVICAHLIVGLDDWAGARDRLKWGEGGALRAIANQADDDPWRRRFRAAVGRAERAALKALANEAAARNQPPIYVVLLARALDETGNWVAAERLLRWAQAAHPADFWVNLELAHSLSFKRPPDWVEAVRFYQAALALRPLSPGVLSNFGVALDKQGKTAEAVEAYRKAIELKPDLPQVHNNLGAALADQRKLAEAVGAFRKAIELKPDLPGAHTNLGLALQAQGEVKGAIECFKKALELDSKDAETHYNLGDALYAQKDWKGAIDCYKKGLTFDPNCAKAHAALGNALQAQGEVQGAIACYKRALELDPKLAPAHSNLGNALQAQGKLVEAVAAFRTAIGLKSDSPVTYYNLGNALQAQRALPEAVVAYRKAIDLKPDYVEAHYNLGNTLRYQGKLTEAEAAYRKAIGLKPDAAEPHCNLGKVLVSQGQFAAALPCLRRGHELGSRNPNWPYPSSEWVEHCERLLRLESRLPALVSGKEQPADAAERLTLADLCRYKKRYAAAARFYEEAFAAEPKQADDLQEQFRYSAACAAALAGSGQGKDAQTLSDKERARLRRQALTWLHADLKAYGQLLNKNADKGRALVSQRLQHWQRDGDFDGVRGPEALAKLPEAEQQEWQQLWADVEDMLARAKAQAASEKKPAGK